MDDRYLSKEDLNLLLKLRDIVFDLNEQVVNYEILKSQKIDEVKEAKLKLQEFLKSVYFKYEINPEERLEIDQKTGELIIGNKK